jgi:hypothetical protein
VLLVVGAAHGGTTIAAMLLAQHPEVFCAGELTDFPNGEQFAADNVCSCGVPARSCGFWRSVRDASGAEVGDRPPEIREVYTQIARLSGCRAIVDVSHGTSRARSLGSMDGLDLRVIKVVRPVEAVVDSQIRRSKERRHSRQHLFSRLMVACRAAFAWGMIENTVKPEMLDCPVIEVSYDRLCADPAGELIRIGDEIGIDYECVASQLASRPRELVRPCHMVRGNRKLRGKESVVLKRDDRYRTGTKPPERVAAKVIGGAPAVLYRVLNACGRVSQQFGKRTLRRQTADAPSHATRT